MREHIAGKLRIDQRHHHADARQTQPYRRILGAVRHEQRYDIAAFQIAPDAPTRILIAAKSQLPMAHRGFGGDERRRRIELCGQAVDQRGKRNSALADRRGLGQRAKPCVAGEFCIDLAGLRRNAHFTVILGIANHTTTTRIVRDTLRYHQPRFTSMKRDTIAVHGGFDSDPTTKAVAVPIYQTAAYSFDSAEHGAALFNLEVPGFRYTRISNPTTEVLEQRVTELEGGVGALSVASGQTALFYASMNALGAGRNLISVPQPYGPTYALFAHMLPKMGIQVRFAKSDRAADLEALIDDDTRAIFCETVGNPAGNVCDLEALAAVAHRHHMPLIVDNTVATPMLVRPVDYGADIVIHSLTKFMGGHGTTLGGIIVDCGTFSWTDNAARYPMFTQPDESYHGLVYTQHYGAAAFVGRLRSVYQRTMGAVLAPMNAFLILQGIETLALRIERHVENGRKVAEFLRFDPRVESVNFAGFADNPYHALVQKYLGGKACSLMTFEIRGGLKAGMRFYNALKLFKRLVNLGDAKSLACHPASTTHRPMPAAEQLAAGVGPGSIRLSVGIEHIDDILADLDQALGAAGALAAPAPLAAASI